MSARTRIALVGAAGRMGETIARAVADSDDIELNLRVDWSLPPDPGPPRSAPDLDLLKPGDVAGIIDFSSPAGTLAAARASARLGCVLVSGTTGLDEPARQALRDASRAIPVCWSPNFSFGIPVLLHALRETAGRLPADWQIEIAEIHHAGKRDAPSGTALRLAEVWRDLRGGAFVHGRSGTPGPRAKDEVGLHAIRVGSVVGEHRVLLGGAGEVLEYSHSVQDRSAFAAGSVEALRRLLARGPGWYEWGDLLCLSPA